MVSGRQLEIETSESQGSIQDPILFLYMNDINLVNGNLKEIDDWLAVSKVCTTTPIKSKKNLTKLMIYNNGQRVITENYIPQLMSLIFYDHQWMNAWIGIHRHQRLLTRCHDC